MTSTRKLQASVALFTLTLLLVVVAAATESVVPLFAAWAPLGLVPWVLTRARPDWERPLGSPTGSEEPAGAMEDSPIRDDPSPTNGRATS